MVVLQLYGLPISIQSIQSFHLTRFHQPVHVMGETVVLAQLLDSKVSTAWTKSCHTLLQREC